MLRLFRSCCARTMKCNLPSTIWLIRLLLKQQSSGKKAGRQEGHKGVSFKGTGHPDLVEKHLPERFACCPNPETCLANATVVETRYVVDFFVQTVATAHECWELIQR